MDQAQPNRLTVFEIELTHGVCAYPHCAICNQKGVEAIAHQLHQMGLEILDFSEEFLGSFGFIDVKVADSELQALRASC